MMVLIEDILLNSFVPANVENMINKIHINSVELDQDIISTIRYDKIRKYGPNPLDDLFGLRAYVPLYCSKKEVTSDDRIIRWEEKKEVEELDIVIEKFINEDKNRIFVLLGNAGSGKSLTLLKL